MNKLKISIKFKTKDGSVHEHPISYNYIDGVVETTLTAEIIDKIKQSEFDEPVVQNANAERIGKDSVLKVLAFTEKIRQKTKVKKSSDIIMMLQIGIQMAFGITDEEASFLKDN